MTGVSLRFSHSRTRSSLPALLSVFALLFGEGAAAQSEGDPPLSLGAPLPSESVQGSPGEGSQGQGERPAIPTDRRAGRRLEISLSDCFALGDRANLDLALARLQELLAVEDSRLADAVFDPEFFATAEWARSKSPPRNAFQPSSTLRRYGGSVGLRKTLITGAALEISFNPRYVDQRVASAFAFPTTFFTGDFAFTATQPLLRGAWANSQLAEFEAARLEELARADDVARSRQETLEQIASAYFELVFRREDYIVRVQSLELSREQLSNTEQKIKLGELAPRDRVADQADVAKKEEELIRAENSILDGEDDLRRLVLPFREDAAWDYIVVPRDVLGADDPAFSVPQLDAALEIARRSRPDLVARRKRVEASTRLLERAQQDLWPTLDLSGTYRASAQRDDFPKLQSDIFRSQFPEYAVSLNFVLPLGNRAARSRRNRARIDLERTERERHILRIDIEKAVRTQVRALRTLGKSMLAARESARLAKNDLESEQIKLRLGEGVRIEVQRRNQQFQDAQTTLLRARLDYRIAWFRLLSALGRIDPTSSNTVRIGP